MRDEWLDKAENQAKTLIRRGACDEVDALVQQAKALFAEDSRLQGLPKACARRQEKDSKEKQEMHQELLAEVREAYKQGEYGRAYRVCDKAHELAPGDQETILLCGMAACRLKKRSVASTFHSKLTEQRPRLLQQVCMKEGVNLTP
jgi:Flp pilus assembly protein TadD